MKTFRFIGMALFAVLMCVNFASCSSSDDDPTEEPEEGGVVVSGKKLAKIVGTSEFETLTLTFNYDNKGRLIEAIETEKEDNEEDVVNYLFTWGDDAIKVSEKRSWSNNTRTYTLSLTNGLVRECSEGETYIYNQSKRLVKLSNKHWTTSAIWDGDKLVSISDSDGDATLTYEKSCKKGYSPFTGIMTFREYNCEPLWMAHPEIAGLLTTQLPATLTWHGQWGDTTTFAYEFDKEGYISKIVGKETESDGSTETYTYTLTWQ